MRIVKGGLYVLRMAPTNITCRFQVLLPLSDCHDPSIEIREKWAMAVMKHFEGRTEYTSIRPWDFVARLDGSVESLATPTSEDSLSEGYPACFQIPHGTLHGLETNEKVERAEKFAMASLLYEIMTSRKPFEGLSDNEVQNRFTRGDFPDDAATLPLWLCILSGWSKEFSEEVARTSMLDVQRMPRRSKWLK